MAENFDLIFGSSASQSYSWNDSDYQKGWQTVGDTPPTREQFDALQRRNDTKAKELNSRLSPLEDKATADGRQTATAYAKGVMVTADGLPNGWLLECIVPGTTGAGALVIPSPLVIGGTIVDGTVTWKLLNLAMGGVPVGYVTPFLQSTAPDGWLSCAGAEVSRTAYPDLWNFVNGSSQLISETDWQNKNTAGDINIGWFSSGDGTTTFRLPRIVGSGELTEVKRFTTAGAGTFVAPVTGVYRITLQGAGGGGAGAGGDSGGTFGIVGGGGGGQGGNYEFYERLTAGTSYAFTIGAGGIGGNSTNSGGSGGESSITIGSDTYRCTGGSGGETVSALGRGGSGGKAYKNNVVLPFGGGKIGDNGTMASRNATANNVNGGSGGGRYGGDGTAGIFFSSAGTLGCGGAGGGYMQNESAKYNSGTNGGDGYIEFAYNPVPQYWYVRAFGSATNQGTIDITELANMLNAKLSISDVPKIAGFSGKQTFTSSGTFTPPVTGNYRITLQGGGGGGGGASNSTSWGYLGGGGGGAGAKITFYERLTAGTTYSFTIGAGGSGGTGANGSSSNGTSGGTSSITINDTLYSATGGGGGTGSAGAGAGGIGGVGSIGGTTVTKGTPGNSGACTSKNASTPIGTGGNGGGETGGWGASGDSQAGINGGGGAGGSVNTTTYSNGGAGGNGYITFEWQSGTI